MNSFVILFALVAAAAASNYNLHGYGNQQYGHGAAYGQGAAYGHGAGYGHARGGYVKYFNDHSGNTVPTMGQDQNNDGLADKLDSNRDGKKDTYNHYGYGHGYGYGAGHAGAAYAGAGYAGAGYAGAGYAGAGYGRVGYAGTGDNGGYGRVGYASHW